MSDNFGERDQYLPPGTRVRHDALCDATVTRKGEVVGEEKSEYGIVVHCWLDEEMGMFDCYIAFFGFDLPPVEKLLEKPYVLRYAAVGLTVLDENWQA